MCVVISVSAFCFQSTADNGSKMLSYSLEYDQGLGESNFVEIYSGLAKQYKLPHLTASTAYSFRLSATNGVGKRLAMI